MKLNNYNVLIHEIVKTDKSVKWPCAICGKMLKIIQSNASVVMDELISAALMLRVISGQLVIFFVVFIVSLKTGTILKNRKREFYFFRACRDKKKRQNGGKGTAIKEKESLKN